jgi:hypothetical protein
LDRAEATIPQRITLTMTVEWERGVEVAMPEVEGTLGDFNVVQVQDGDVTGDDLVRRQQRVVTLESVVPGECQVPVLSVAFADPRPKADGSSEVYEDKVSTERIPVAVRQALADVKGPVGLPLAWRYRLLLWAVGVVAAAAAIALAARWWRRRRARLEELGVKARMPAHEWALAELERLAREGLLTKGLVQEFYYRINGLVRRYIELRYGLMANEQTSEEFIRALKDSAFLGDGHKEVLRGFVSACDPVKYARHRPEAADISWVQATARDFILQTAEREVAKEGAGVPG